MNTLNRKRDYAKKERVALKGVIYDPKPPPYVNNIRPMIHARYETKPPPRLSKICPTMYANSETRKLCCETVSSGQNNSPRHTRELWYARATKRNSSPGPKIFVL